MTAYHKLPLLVLGLSVLLTLSSCAIKDDIPYPVLVPTVTDFRVEGQCDDMDTQFADAVIDKKNCTIEVNVGDIVDLSALRILAFQTSDDDANITTITPNPFERTFDFTSGSQTFVLQTYPGQEYKWKVSVRQIILRDVQLEGQVGDAVIDEFNHTVVAYVSESQDLSKIKVETFTLGGQHGRVSPDPTASATYDFSKPRTFEAISAATGKAVKWTVYVYKTTEKEKVTLTVYPHSAGIYLSGNKPKDTTPVVEYRMDGNLSWFTLPAENVVSTTRTYTAYIPGLTPATNYEILVSAGDVSSDLQTVTTVGAQHLENGSFDNWSISGSGNNALYQPWGDGEESYWDTGNRGATTVGASNSTYVDEGSRRYANLQSKYIVIKFAAGNIFTGKYLKTDGSNGVLSFGRPFTSYPTALRFTYKYKTSTINKSANWSPAYADYISKSLFDGLIGKPDSCSVYVALGDWDPVDYNGEKCPYLIKTKPSELHLFDPNDSHVIAYGQMTKGTDVSTWTTETITLNYRVTNRQPKYIIIVASSSKYGDYFAGGEGSLLQLDDMELLYK